MDYAAVRPFVHEAIASETLFPDGSEQRTYAPAVWTLAHRGYSGGGRLDVWVYQDRETAIRAAAELAMNCGLDEDSRAARDFKAGRYTSVIERYRETSPPAHCLSVQEAFFMADADYLCDASVHLASVTSIRRDDDGASELVDWPALKEIADIVGPNRREAIAAAAASLAADIRHDSEHLGEQAVKTGGKTRLRVLDQLPPQTFHEDQQWRQELAASAECLGDDALRWGAPIPRCTAEEMMLHLILRRAAIASGCTAAKLFNWADDNPPGWGDLYEYLFQDHDVLMLFDATPGPNAALGMLAPAAWFDEFGPPFPLPDRPV